MKIYNLLLFIVLLGMYSCHPEDIELGSVLSADDLKFSVTQDSSDPNMIYLESLTDGVTPLWQTSVGRSTSIYDTLKIPFAGEYYVVYGVTSAGGYIESTDSVIITLTTDNFDYVDDDLWTYLSGGVGYSKTWIADNGEYGLASGPMEYADPSGTVEWNNFTPNWSPSASDFGLADDDELWESTMTFSLIGGAIMTTNKVNEGVEEEGTYMLDVDNHTLSTYDATIVRLTDFIEKASNWTTDLKILTLDENQLQIAILRDYSDEDPWYLIFNYVSKDYADSYEGEEVIEEPDLPDGWEDDVSEYTSYTIKWVLSTETPFNWANLDGSLMNDWSSASDYPSWTGFDSSVPDSYANFSMEMNSQTGVVTYTDPDGNATTGTYTLDEDGIYTFDGVTPYFLICSNWVYLSTTADNQWRILDLEYESGSLTGMWVGVLSDDGSQYMCYLLEPEVGGSSSQEDSGTELTVDNSKILYGNLEDNNDKYRIEIYNTYGGTSSDSPIDPDAVIIDEKVEITFSISGLTFVDGAVGSYETSGYLVNSSWTGYTDGSGTEATVTGDGTYTVTYYPSVTIDGVIVFVIDILDMVPDIADIDAVSCTVDKIVMY